MAPLEGILDEDDQSEMDERTLKWWQKYREFYTAPITKFWVNVVS